MNHKYKIFKEVALKKSFTSAAKTLNLSQSAVSKSIKSLEESLNVTLFYRNGNKIELSPKAEKLLKYVFDFEDIDFKIKNEIVEKKQKDIQCLKLGASTTIANYIIPIVYKDLLGFGNIQSVELISGNSSLIETKLTEHELDFGVVENIGKNTQLHYIPFVEDEIVLCCNQTNRIKDEIDINELINLPIISREYGSGTQKVTIKALNKVGVKNLNIISVFDNTEGIKNILKRTNDFAFLSVHAIADEVLNNELKIIEVKNLEIKRMFNFIVRQGFQLNFIDSVIERIKESYKNKR
ncbi:LysR family transcriptional regulator [Weeksellaceae bacterium TAE3-ERU29]|nr:LysR family transcriptional regulator [Weeksellaceae bacterium TAE3-ERU29]